MTEMRDARLKRALQSAPDADAAPGAATRRSIRDAAGRAIASPSRAKAWWQGIFEARRPWNAAFATLVVAVLVGVMYRGLEEDPAPEAQKPVVTAPAPAPAPAQPPPVAEAAPKSKAPPGPKAQAPAAPPALADAATSQVGEGLARRDMAKAGEERVAAAAAPAPARARAAAEWTDLRITSGGRSVVVPRSQAPALDALIQQQPASPAGADATADVRIELLLGGQRIGVIAVSPDQAQLREQALRLLQQLTIQPSSGSSSPGKP